MRKFRVTIRCPECDFDGRQSTVKKFVKAVSETAATITALGDYPGWEVIKVEEV